MVPSNRIQQFLRLPLLALLLFVVSSLVTSCDSQETIVNGLTEKEANEIVVFLAAKGIKVTKVASTEGGGPGGGGEALYNITVEAGRATEAMAILNMNGLPRRKGQDLLTLFQQGGLVPSEMEEKIRYQAGLAEQIASTIRKIDGVLDADIQLSFPEEDPLNPGKKTGRVTASVYVKHQGVLDDPNTHLVTKIKRLVASSIIDLEYDNVTVISDRARFSDVAVNQLPGGALDQDREYVSVWSIVLAKESLTRFRTVFFSFIFVFLTMGLVVIWLSWKVFPVLQQSGGVKKLFTLAPLAPGAGAEEGEEEEKAASEEETEEEKASEAEEEKAEEEEDQESKEVT